MNSQNVILVVAATSLGIAGASSAAQDKPCELVTAAEVRAIAGTTAGQGASGYLEPTGTYSCEYKWTVKDFSPSLLVLVSDPSKVFPGLDKAALKAAILGGPRGLPKNAMVVSSVGEAATYTEETPTTGSGLAYVKGRILQVVYRNTDVPAKKSQVVGLLKAAASRL